jgi:hypothetical protein
MGQSLQEKRWAENEVLFKKANKNVTDSIASAKALAEEEGQLDLVGDIDDTVLQFVCECSNAKCRERISITPKEYINRHKNKSQFILVPGHHNPEIERIVNDCGKFIVVEKYKTPPYNVSGAVSNSPKK